MLLKNCTIFRWLRLLTLLLPDRIYIALSPWHFGDFRNIFLPNIGEDQKKSYDLSARPQLVLRNIVVNPALINALYVYKKAGCGPEIATYRTKTLHFFRVKRLNWVATIELRRPEARGF